MKPRNFPTSTFNRRTFIKTGALVVPATAYQAIYIPPAVAHPHPIDRDLVVGSRVFARENQIYGVTAYSFPTVRLAEEVIGSLEAARVQDEQEAIGRLLYVSYAQEFDNFDPREISDMPGFLRNEAESVYGELRESIQDDSVCCWVQIRTSFVLLIRARSGILFLVPFINGFYDVGRYFLNLLIPWLEERIQQ